jgi:hypothetical protein
VHMVPQLQLSDEAKSPEVIRDPTTVNDLTPEARLASRKKIAKRTTWEYMLNRIPVGD